MLCCTYFLAPSVTHSEVLLWYDVAYMFSSKPFFAGITEKNRDDLSIFKQPWTQSKEAKVALQFLIDYGKQKDQVKYPPSQ